MRRSASFIRSVDQTTTEGVGAAVETSGVVVGVCLLKRKSSVLFHGHLYAKRSSRPNQCRGPLDEERRLVDDGVIHPFKGEDFGVRGGVNLQSSNGQF